MTTAAWRLARRAVAGAAARRAAAGGGAPRRALGSKVATERLVKGMPPLRFRGRVRVVGRAADAEEALAPLAGLRVVGVDTESFPSHQLQTVQVASTNYAVVFRRDSFKDGVPDALGRLLEDPAVIKAGQQPYREVIDFERDYGVRMAGVADVSHVARELGVSPLNLRALVGRFMGARLCKEQQRSDWRRRPLSPEQIHYAAADAFVAREVLLRSLDEYAREHSLAGGFEEALARSEAVIGAYRSDLDEIARGVAAAGLEPPALPTHLDAFQTYTSKGPRQLLAEFLQARGNAKEAPADATPVYETLAQRPEGYLVRCTVPELGISRTHTHPMETVDGAASFAALKVLHALGGGNAGLALERSPRTLLLEWFRVRGVTRLPKPALLRWEDGAARQTFRGAVHLRLPGLLADAMNGRREAWQLVRKLAGGPNERWEDAFAQWVRSPEGRRPLDTCDELELVVLDGSEPGVVHKTKSAAGTAAARIALRELDERLGGALGFTVNTRQRWRWHGQPVQLRRLAKRTRRGMRKNPEAHQ